MFSWCKDLSSDLLSNVLLVHKAVELYGFGG